MPCESGDGEPAVLTVQKWNPRAYKWRTVFNGCVQCAEEFVSEGVGLRLGFVQTEKRPDCTTDGCLRKANIFATEHKQTLPFCDDKHARLYHFGVRRINPKADWRKEMRARR